MNDKKWYLSAVLCILLKVKLNTLSFVWKGYLHIDFYEVYGYIFGSFLSQVFGLSSLPLKSFLYLGILTLYLKC